MSTTFQVKNVPVSSTGFYDFSGKKCPGLQYFMSTTFQVKNVPVSSTNCYDFSGRK
jgi:hypothetical protein